MSTFSYNTGVPAANNNPSVDQPEMQTNTASINSLLAIDHVSFNTTGGGRHNQVTFSGNNPPALPVALGTLFANNVDGQGNTLPGGVSQFFFNTGTLAQSESQYTNLNRQYGSTLLPGGIIMKFGLLGGVSPSGLIVTFTQPFPNNCFLAVACQEATTGAGVYMSTTVLSTSQIKIFSNIGTGLNCNYIAIGN